jgi:hypothetical protein
MSFARKAILGAGAIAVSTMALTGAATAKPKVHIDLHLGGWAGPYYGGFYPGYRADEPCYYFKKKWFNTGKSYWKKKYFKCMGWW